MKNTLVGIAVGLLVGAAVAPASADHGADFRTLSRKVNSLQKQVNTLKLKTADMNTEGFYLGAIVGNQVLGTCPTGSTAVWETLGNEVTMIDDCVTAQTTQARQLRARFDR